ncbi:hypothetical protein [Streptomyces sp. NPDC018693]|uniref:hypothetical protein n=1 Tax=unclassified Streptomyces TaxID=2593676 RepID=UPI00379F5AB2
MAVLDDGVVARPELTIAVDVATRTICAALLGPAGTKGVDAAVLLARMLVPEPMRPGWSQTLAMSDSILPQQRLMAVDARLEKAAAKPVIVPDTIVIDWRITSNCCPRSGRPSTTTASRSTTAPTTALSSTGCGGSRPG